MADVVRPTLAMTPPDPSSLRVGDLLDLMQLGRRFRKLPRADQALLIKTMTMSCAGLLDEWFESPELKASLAATGTIGTYGSPRTPGTAFVFLHYYLGEANGAPGAWGFVRGGMGGIAQALADAARAAGAVIRVWGRDRAYLEEAFDDFRSGRPSRRPYLDMVIPSTVDATLAPAGHHVMSISMKFIPYRPAEGDWRTRREELGDLALDTLAGYASNIRRAVIYRQVLTPLCFEEVYGLTGGNICHGDMALDQLFAMRPLLGWARDRTPVRNLYMCGAGTHPGGGVMGAPGRNAARELRKDLRRGRARRS